MTNWKILSVEGSQQYTFSSGYVLAAGETVYVNSGPDATNDPPGNLHWTTAYIWNNDGDETRLGDGQIYGGYVAVLRMGNQRRHLEEESHAVALFSHPIA